ncbi:hypothetical protein HA402_013044 [Bradysia odoriphaga]|nr:hypothetical protein HA402_013044 [Bradysia odoriphaga]
MSHPHEDEISEIIEYITGMRRTFNRKLDDHLFIMEQQNHRIEEQYRIIDEQRIIIDELAWQIRDLRDSVRQVSEQKSSCVCNYENHVSRHRSKEHNSVQGSNRINCRIEEIDEGHEDIYEKIDVTSNHPPADRSNPVPLARNINQPSTPKYSEVNKLEPNKSNNVTINRTTRYIRPANSVQGTLPDRTDISNSLHDALHRLKFENLAERDSIDEEGTGDILLRTKPFKQFSRNSQRGSSKVMCSMVSDIEQAYLPNEEELDEENFVRISSRHVVSDAVIDYDDKGNTSKRAGVVL